MSTPSPGYGRGRAKPGGWSVSTSAGGATGPPGPDGVPLLPLSPQGSPPWVLAQLLLRVRPEAPTPSGMAAFISLFSPSGPGPKA